MLERSRSADPSRPPRPLTPRSPINRSSHRSGVAAESYVVSCSDLGGVMADSRHFSTGRTHHGVGGISDSRHFSTGRTLAQHHQQQHYQQQHQVAYRHLTGQERVVGVSSRVDESRTHIIGERTVERCVTVPKRIIHEDIIETVIVVPEARQREEIIDEVQIVHERIIEVAKPIIQEKIVEIPEIEYRDKIIEVPEVIVQEKIKQVPRIEVQERLREVPKIITQERIVEIPEIEYREVPYEKIIEIPEMHEQIVTKEIPIPQYIDQPYPEYVDVEVPVDITRNIPVPVEAVSTFEYRLANLKSRVTKIQYPIYVPRFIEVPVPEETFHARLLAELNQNCAQVGLLGEMTQAVSLCEVENLATMVRSVDVGNSVASTNLHEALKTAWLNGQIHVSQNERSLHSTINFTAKSRKASRRNSGQF